MCENNYNILYIASERKLGGATKSLLILMQEMQAKGHGVFVVTPFGFGPFYEEVIRAGIPCKPIFFGWWQMPEYWNAIFKFGFRCLYFMEWVAVIRISFYIKKKKIDIVHSNSSVIDVGAKAAKKCNIPHIWHFREFGKDDYQLEYLKGREKSLKYVEKNTDKVVFISKSLREYYKAVPESISEVIYNGISEDFLHEKVYSEKKKQVVFLISGNLQRNKGQMTALLALKDLLEQGETDAVLWVAGRTADTADSKKYEQELKEYAKKNLGETCKFLGFIKDIQSIRSQADVELVCSNREAFGRVTIEAMMAGNPVIASDTGANPELIIDRENGVLFANNNSNDLAEKMKWFLDYREEIVECGTHAYKFAKEGFISQKNTKQIELVYNKMLSGKGKKETKYAL